MKKNSLYGDRLRAALGSLRWRWARLREAINSERAKKGNMLKVSPSTLSKATNNRRFDIGFAYEIQSVIHKHWKDEYGPRPHLLFTEDDQVHWRKQKEAKPQKKIVDGAKQSVAESQKENVGASKDNDGDYAMTGDFGLVIPNRKGADLFRKMCATFKWLAGKKVTLHGLQDPNPVDNPADALKFCQHLIDAKVKGVFFAPFEHIDDPKSKNQEIVSELSRHGIEVVLLDRDIYRFPKRSDIDLVAMDNLAAGEKVAASLLKTMRQDKPTILFLQRRNAAPSVELRLRGVNEALRRKNLPPLGATEGDPSDEKFVKSHAEADAIICANDETAASLASTFKSLKLARRPLLAGFDGLQDREWITVYQNPKALARAAWILMQNRLRFGDDFPPVMLLINPGEVLDGSETT